MAVLRSESTELKRAAAAFFLWRIVNSFITESGFYIAAKQLWSTTVRGAFDCSFHTSALSLPCYHKGFSTRASRSCSRCTIVHPCSAPLIRLPGPPRSSCSEDFFAQLLPIPTSASDLCDSFRALRLFQTPKTSSDHYDSF